MPPHFDDSDVFPLDFYGLGEMSLRELHPVGDAHRRKKLPGPEIVPYFPEYPRMPESGAAYHYSIDAVAVKRILRVLRRPYVPVAYDGYMHSRIILHLAYKCPVRIALVHLAARASVNRKRLYSRVLKSLREFDDNL